MKNNRLLVFSLLTVLLTVSMACNLTGLLEPTQSPPDAEELSDPTAAPPLAEATAEATATDAPAPTLTPTEAPPSRGQIVYTFGGNIWRYLVDSGENLQLTFDGVADSYEGGYRQPLLSADGRYVSYSKNDVSYLHTLADNSVVSLPITIFQWSRTQPAAFYAASGGLTCPAVEDVDDQSLINFDLMRYSMDDLTAPAIIANIGGGLNFPQAISNDEQYASVLRCYCYSECGSYSLYRLPAGDILPLPADVYLGEVDFSPDSSRLTTSHMQGYGYYESPLYLANSDFSGAVILYQMPNVAVISPRWSPDGGWIAFTAYDIAGDMELADKRVLLTNLDGSVQLEIAVGNAQFGDWSPDGSQLLFHRGEWNAAIPFIYDLLSGSTTELPFTGAWHMDWGILP